MDQRVKIMNEHKHSKNVLYLMNRDQRFYQNYSLQLAYDLSYESKTNLFIGFDFCNMKMNERQKVFVLQGLIEMEEDSKNNCVPIYIVNDFKAFISDFQIDSLVLDFSPLREIRKRDEQIAKLCKSEKIALYRCDSHNIVPCHLLNTYKRTPKAVKCDLYKLYDKYLIDFKDLNAHTYNQKCIKLYDKDTNILDIVSFKDVLALKYANSEIFKDPIKQYIKENIKRVKLGNEFIGGYKKGIDAMNDFFNNRFSLYSKERNNPDIFALSNLSPWIHTGHLSTQFILNEASKKFGNTENFQTLVDEMFIWKEIAEHFVLHEPNYDNINGALGWVKETLKTHKTDKREIIYSETELRHSKTSDKLWNAAQNELLITGKIHGYVRMYWAKRILEWTRAPEEALEIALNLNDEYSIDGNDCNGYLGVMWSICGSMDRAFKERPIFGKIRFMRSFKCPGYISKWCNSKK